jgi:chromosome segregation ATPase
MREMTREVDRQPSETNITTSIVSSNDNVLIGNNSIESLNIATDDNYKEHLAEPDIQDIKRMLIDLNSSLETSAKSTEYSMSIKEIGSIVKETFRSYMSTSETQINELKSKLQAVTEKLKDLVVRYSESKSKIQNLEETIESLNESSHLQKASVSVLFERLTLLNDIFHSIGKRITITEVEA